MGGRGLEHQAIGLPVEPDRMRKSSDADDRRAILTTVRENPVSSRC